MKGRGQLVGGGAAPEPLPLGRIGRNASYLLVSDVGARVLTALVAILVARYLGPEGYGNLSIALAFSGVAAYFADLGLTHVMVREGTRPGADLATILGGGLRLRLIFGAATVILVVPASVLYTDSPLLRVAILAVTVPAILGTAVRGLANAYFQATQEMGYVAVMNLLGAAVLGVVLVVGVVLRFGVPALSFAYGLSSVMAGATGLWLTLRRVTLASVWHRGLVQGLFAFTAAGFLGLLIPHLGPLVVPVAAGVAETGYYSAAFRIPGFLYALPSVIALAFYPQLFAYGSRDLSLHKELVLKEVRVLGFLGVLLALPISLNASWVIAVVFGSEWSPRSGPALGVLAWIVAVQGLSIPLGDALTTRGLQARRTLVLASGALVGLAVCWVLARRWGAVGAAWAALGVEGLILVGNMVVNPDRLAFIAGGVLPVLPKLAVSAACCWAIRAVLGEGLVGGLAMGGALVGGGLAMDRDLRGLAWRVLVSVRRRGWRRCGAP